MLMNVAVLAVTTVLEAKPGGSTRWKVLAQLLS